MTSTSHRCSHIGTPKHSTRNTSLLSKQQTWPEEPSSCCGILLLSSAAFFSAPEVMADLARRAWLLRQHPLDKFCHLPITS